MAPKIETTLLEFVNRTPPILVWAMASKKSRGHRSKHKSLTEIVTDSQLPRRTVQRIIYRDTWAGIKLETASKFIKGCGVDIFDKQAIYDFIVHQADKNFPHLNKSQHRRLFEVMRWNQ